MTEEDWVSKCNGRLTPCRCVSAEPKIVNHAGRYYALCWYCGKSSSILDHAYQAVNSWNEARRGEMK